MYEYPQIRGHVLAPEDIRFNKAAIVQIPSKLL